MVTLILGREDWSAENWANAFFKCYYRRWGVPARIITDRGKVFLSDFWTALFKILRTSLLVTTAYHPQSDGQSERTNQTVEIALRHLVNAKKDDWPSHLPEVEFTINNMVNTSTNRAPMEFLTGIVAPSAVDAATAPPGLAKTWSATRDRLRAEARDALLFAQTKMSIYYDKRHAPISFKVGDLAYVRVSAPMQPGYHLSNETSTHKLSQQRIGPFKIIDKVGRLAYKLEIPSTWKIHPVVSVAHLEPHTPDPFERTEVPVPDLLEGHDGEVEPEWEIEEILRKRYNKRRKRDEYYVKWKGFGPETNTLEPEENMIHAREALERFNNDGTLATVASTYFLPSPPVTPFYNASAAVEFVAVEFDA
jgi:hypothetical protein